MALDKTGKELPKGITWQEDKQTYMARFTYQGTPYTFYEKDLRTIKQTLKDKRYEVEHGMSGKADKITLNQWYETWLKLFNLKEAAKTLNFLTDNGLTDYDELAARAEEAGQKFDAASAGIKQVETRLSELSELRTHIVNYSKTREIYAAFRKVKNKKEYLAAHESELAMHEAAKKAFDKLGGAKIPTVAQIQAEYSSLLTEKKELYETYRAARKKMIE